jgi:hypothetical protein
MSRNILVTKTAVHIYTLTQIHSYIEGRFKAALDPGQIIWLPSIFALCKRKYVKPLYIDPICIYVKSEKGSKFEILTAVVMNSTVFWDTKPRSSVKATDVSE